MIEPILRVENLSISFLQEKKWNEVIHSISFDVFPNEIVGIVGESGSGKSVSSLAVMGLLPKNVSDLNTGSIHFKNEDITNYSEKAFQKIRGRKISMIFQEPMSSLNPSINCGEQVAEILATHTHLSEKEIKAEVLRLFDQVKLPDPNTIYNKYPHQISGGQKQRVMIAMAIACKPEILIADEPTTALDVTVQQEIILLLKNLQQETGMSILFISHDLSLISEICDRILVMFKGEIVEQNSALNIFKNPEHIYTKALIASRPSLNVRLKRLPTIQDYLSGTENAAAISQEERKEHLD